MSTGDGPTPDPSPVVPDSIRLAVNILAGAAILALLYLGREILVPITLAAILSLVIAPLVRLFKRRRLGQFGAVLSAVGLVTLVLGGVAVAIAMQLSAMSQKLPEYEQTLRSKLQLVQTATLDRLQAMEGDATQLMGAPPPLHGRQTRTVPVEIHEPRRNALTIVWRLLSSVWAPLGTTAIVLVTLVFALLEHESLRDRFIRLAGGDLRATSHALNDAGERLSRYFLSQLAVNTGVGVIAGLGLALIGVPQALLWGVLTALLRFVPYVGIFLAAGAVALFGAAADPGWTLCLGALSLFVAVELIVAQIVEPLLYGHSTGLSPISVVVAAIFWGWIWGPVGLLLSTPLTLCLVVAGRNVRGLAFLDILFGDTPALTLSQRFYQRSLAGDAHELIADARKFLARSSLARYCDEVLMPALQLAGRDFAAGSISPLQQQNVRATMASLLARLGPKERPAGGRRGKADPADDAGPGQLLRRQREAVLGRYQGPLEVPPGSVALCIGMGSQRDDLVTEILVRVLRDAQVDARHISIADLDHRPAEAKAGSVALVFIASMDPAQEGSAAAALAGRLHELLPGVPLVAVLPAAVPAEGRQAGLKVDAIAHSYSEALEEVRRRFQPN
ncbi:AI-2E family transporter [Xylophilus rhododendri]|uniref:AI-2E family transporter n=1 Tax=Xylophilus rhododendri TaxID=2697032 RepID=A0A857J2D5_9BURK|nr:AI-2E family transporter [Xylophilus rhododendri]QHI97088.1 AI-2E family transporter [Xylophilus rhododendri]